MITHRLNYCSGYLSRFFLGLVLLSVASFSPYADELGKIELSYVHKEWGTQQRHELSSSEVVGNGEYSLHADVHFAQQEQKKIYEQLPLYLDNAPKLGHFFFDSDALGALETSLSPDSEGGQSAVWQRQREVVSDYDQLWIDYQDLTVQNPTVVNFELTVEPKRHGQHDENGADFYLLSSDINHSLVEVEVEVEDIINTSMRARDQLYLLKRVLGLSADVDWRYLQEGEHVVLQRRFDRGVSEYTALDLIMKAGTPLERVNLCLSSEEEREIIVQWEAIPKQINIDSQGKMRVRLLLDKMLKQQFSRQEGVVLEEMVVFVTGTVTDVLKNKPLHSLRWMGFDVNNKKADWQKKIDMARAEADTQYLNQAKDQLRTEVITVPVQQEQLKNGRKRLKIELGADVRREVWGGEIRSAKLFLQQQHPDRLGGVDLLSARLVSLYDAKVPAIVSLGNDQLHQWGVGGEQISESGHEQFTWPVVTTYRSFRGLANVDLYREESSERLGFGVVGTEKSRYRWSGEWDTAQGENGQTEIVLDLFFLDEEPVRLQLPDLKEREVVIRALEGVIRFERHGNSVDIFPESNPLYSPKGFVQGRIALQVVKEDGEYADLSNMGEGNRVEQHVVQFPRLMIEGKEGDISSQVSERGLKISGAEEWLDIKWSVSQKATETPQSSLDSSGHRIYLGIAEGSEAIQGIQLLNSLASDQFILPNHSFLLDQLEGALPEQLDLRIFLKPGRHDLLLGELVLFKESTLSFKQLLQQPLPQQGVFSLKADPVTHGDGVFVSQNEKGLSFLLVDSKSEKRPLPQWTTSLQQYGGAVRQLLLEYSVPFELPLASPCWLNVQLFNKHGDMVNRQLCLERAAGRATLPLAEWLALEQGWSESDLERIAWQVDWPDSLGSKPSYEMHFSMQWNGVMLRTPQTLIESAPLVRWKSEALYPTLSENLIDAGGYGGSVSLGSLQLENEIVSEVQFEALSHPWLKTKRITLQRDVPYSLEEWRSLTEPAPVEQSDRLEKWIKWLTYLAMAGVVWMLMRHGMLKWGGQLLWKVMQWLIQLPLNLWVWLYRKLKIRALLVNRLLGLILMGPGGWILGVASGHGYFLFIVLGWLLLMAGVTWYEFKERLSLSLSMLLVPLVVALFSFELFYAGRYQWTFWMLLPWLALGYLLLPWLSRTVENITEWQRSLILWLGVTVALYVGGIFAPIAQGENYWFTVGGMAAVMTWRAWVWLVQPWLDVRWSGLAAKVYGGSGTHYFSGFIVVLLGIVTMLMLNLEPVAEQLAVIGYYMLVVGVVLEMKVLRRDRLSEAASTEGIVQ